MMRALVVYESMYGNTRRVAEAVVSGLASSALAQAVSVAEVTAADVAGCELLIVGGPTHVHGMSRTNTRNSAATVAEATGSLSMEPNADAGIRDWLEGLRPGVPGQKATAFDTGAQGPALLTGRASKSPGELERARLWGETLAVKAASTP